MNNNSNNRLIEISSMIAFFIGLIYAGFLLILNILKNRSFEITEVQIIAVLLATGLLGNVLNFILKKIVKDKIDQYFDEEKIQEYIQEQVQKIRFAEAEELNKNEIDERSENIELNTVIVPVHRTLENVKSEKIYSCPSTYTFKSGLEYIAFYKEKKVVGYGKLSSSNNYNVPINGEKKFKIEKFVDHNIIHNKKGAFIQNKMYCNFNKLEKATTTDEIRE